MSIAQSQSRSLGAWLGAILRRDYRPLFARLPLPMLALAASYGVYRFSALFVPFWVAVVQAAAFELTYIGLASQRDLSDDARKRATYISIGAVAVSIIYNSLAGLFERNPDWLDNLHPGFEWGLSLLHGAPLALVAYLVADLLLHSEGSNLAHVVAELRATIDGLRASLAQRDSTVRDRDLHIAQTQQSGTAAAHTLRELTTQLAHLTTQTTSDARTITDLRAALAQRDTDLRDSSATTTTTAQTLREMREQLDLARATITEQATHIAQATTDRAVVERTITELRATLAQPRTVTFDAVLDYARTLQAQNMSLRDIAERIGTTESTLRGWLKK